MEVEQKNQKTKSLCYCIFCKKETWGYEQAEKFTCSYKNHLSFDVVITNGRKGRKVIPVVKRNFRTEKIEIALNVYRTNDVTEYIIPGTELSYDGPISKVHIIEKNATDT